MNTLIQEKLKAWRNSALLFVTDAIHATPTDQQAEGLVALAKEKRITIRSGHGTGKDAFAVWAILWFMTTRAFAKVACTAPTNRQLKDILWSELSKWLRKSILSDEFILQSEKMFHKDFPKEYWCRAISPSTSSSKEDQQETLAGLHADHLFIVCDEASGIKDPVFVPLEGAMTQEDNRVLLIGNMTRNSGYFYDTHYSPIGMRGWKQLHWDSEKSPNVRPGYVEYMSAKYGRDSNVFKVRVKGEPPDEDARTLIPLPWAIQCIGNEIYVPEEEPLYLGVDVARYGEDKSIILPRKGLKIHPWKSFDRLNTILLGGHIIETYTELEAEGIGIDDIGVGGGVADWLMLRPGARNSVIPVNVATQSSDPKRYARLRDELWWLMRERCEKAQYSFPDATAKEREMSDELCNELASLTYDFNGNGAVKVESKEVAKRRGVSSPNIADALGISEYFASDAYRVFTKPRTPKRKHKKKGTVASPLRWMAA